MSKQTSKLLIECKVGHILRWRSSRVGEFLVTTKSHFQTHMKVKVYGSVGHSTIKIREDCSPFPDESGRSVKTSWTHSQQKSKLPGE